jgi:hypothetical protein
VRTRKWMSVVKTARGLEPRATNNNVEVVLDSRKGLEDVAEQAKRDAEDLWIDRTVRRCVEIDH